LRRGLEERGFAVDVAFEGEEGDDKARTTSYDLIVLNSMAPKGDSLTLLQQWRRAGITADVFVLTPRGGIKDGVRWLDLGADGYLTIPFDPQELFARIQALIRRGQRGMEAMLRIHDLEIDTTTRIVKRQGKRILLTPREYALLKFLAERQGRVVSRALICNDLYGCHTGDMSNIVDVYVRYLRKKIDAGFEPPLILTRWGEGYLLRGDGA
jgi:DNA-binding response OmpR family regulator